MVRVERMSLAAVALLAGGMVCGGTLDEVRVRETPAGPQIHVNGEAVPARWLFARPTTHKLAAGGDWRAYDLPVTAEADVSAARLVIRHDQVTNCVLQLRNMSVVAVSNGVECAVKGAVRPEKPWFNAIRFARGVTYRYRFEARAEGIDWIRPLVLQEHSGIDIYNYAYQCIPFDDESILTITDQLKKARRNGVRFVSPLVPNCWRPEGEENFGPMDKVFRLVIAAVPDAIIVPRVQANAPEWWLREHPGNRVSLANGKVLGWACVHSREYRRDGARYLERVSRHLLETFPDNFGGIHYVGQDCGEWCYYGCWTSTGGTGCSPAATNAFRAYLADAGRPDAATAVPPTYEERRLLTPDGVRLIDPSRRRRLVDFNRFLQKEMYDCMCLFAEACRRGTAGKRLVVCFGGYAWEHVGLWSGASLAGSAGLWDVLKDGCLDVDVLCSPVVYSDRGWIGSTPVIGPAETIMRHGILWMNEDDFRTPLADDVRRNPQYCFVTNRCEMVEVLKRTVAQEAIRGMGEWWMDLPGLGWFDDEEYWRTLAAFAPDERRLMARRAPYAPDVALTIHEEGHLHCGAAASQWTGPLVQRARGCAARSGFAFGQYLWEDVLARPTGAKLEINLSSYYVSPETLARAKRHAAATPDVTRVWCWAPGYVTDRGFDAANTEALTGFKVSPRSLKTGIVTPTAAGRAAGFPEGVGVRLPSGPWLAVETRPGDEVWATWSDGSAAVVLRPHEGSRGYEVFYGAGGWTPQILRALADRAGVRTFCSPEAVGKVVLFAGEGCVAVQAHEAGTYEISDWSGAKHALEFKSGEVKMLK